MGEASADPATHRCPSCTFQTPQPRSPLPSGSALPLPTVGFRHANPLEEVLFLRLAVRPPTRRPIGAEINRVPTSASRLGTRLNNAEPQRPRVAVGRTAGAQRCAGGTAGVWGLGGSDLGTGKPWDGFFGGVWKEAVGNLAGIHGVFFGQ